jgi:Tol biopolymer transport system component
VWPTDLTGSVVGYGFLSQDARAGGLEESIFYMDLSEGTPKELGPGSWPALSPDGSQVAYTGSDGLYVLDLASEVKRKIPGTHEYDYHPRWSPDGSQIAFYRKLDDNIYIINADGSNPRMLTEYGEIELLVDWLPDGRRLAFGVPSANMELRLLDVDTGDYQVSTVFDSWALDVGISPEGTTMAFVEGQATGAERVLMSDFERSEVNRVAQFDQRWILSYPVFSPDGNWLAISVTDRQSDKITPALINLKTCDTYAMKGVDGQLFDWSR